MFQALIALAFLMPAGQPASRVSGVTAARAGTAMVVTLSFTGATKSTEPALLPDPWRLYFDLPGVLPAAEPSLAVGTGTVQHVRMALNRRVPPRTRVVIALTSKPVWRVERDADGRTMRVLIENVFPADADGAAASTRGTVIYLPPATPAPAVDRREDIKSQLFAMVPSLEAMRDWKGPSDAELANLIAAADTIATGARAMQISGAAGDLALVAAIDAVSAAAKLRATALGDGTPQSRANAIAAASGALLLIEHARNVNGKSFYVSRSPRT